jgi:hypothetical protein
MGIDMGYGIFGTWLTGTSTQHDDMKSEILLDIDKKLEKVNLDIEQLKTDVKDLKEK